MATLLVLLGVVANAGCLKQQEASESGTAPSGQATTTAVDPAVADQSAAGLSLFEGTPYYDNPPQALTVNRTCSQVAFKSVDFSTSDITVFGGVLDPVSAFMPQEYYSDPGMMHVQMAMHPTERRVLTTGVLDLPDGPVIDKLWDISPGRHFEVPYYEAHGFSLDFHGAAYHKLVPYYSWDGETIIIPLNSEGLVLYGEDGALNEFLPYPEFPGQFTGLASGPLPDEDGVRRIFVNLWEAGMSRQEYCEINILNLDSLKWERKVIVEWPVYEIGASSLDNDPWLISGSRPPIREESRRQARLALLDPDNGYAKLLPLGGEPVWRVVLDPKGNAAVYVDHLRQGIVRLDFSSNFLEVDPRWSTDNEDASIFVGVGGDPVYVWDGKMLIKAEFSGLEDMESIK